MTYLEKVQLAADVSSAHDHLMLSCPWYRDVSGGHGSTDPEACCKPAKGKGGPPKLVVKMTPHTAEASTVDQPTVPPGGPGLFHVKGLHLPPYVQHLYKHLVGRYGKEKAYGVAVGVVKKWAAGTNPGGKHPTKTHADVRAAAGRNVAEWEADRAKAHQQSREHAVAAAAASGVALLLAVKAGSSAGSSAGRPRPQGVGPKGGSGAATGHSSGGNSQHTRPAGGWTGGGGSGGPSAHALHEMHVAHLEHLHHLHVLHEEHLAHLRAIGQGTPSSRPAKPASGGGWGGWGGHA